MQAPIPLPICGRNNSNKENIIDAASISIIPACSVAGLMGMGLMIMVNPKIPKILKILLPTIFPIMTSFCFLIDAKMAVVSSGKEVPTATTVKPITASEILKDLAMVTAASISK